MDTKNLIPVIDFCTNHKIEITFINSLQQFGLISLTTINQVGFIDISQLKHLERIVQFHFDLDINLEGIETINHLLKRISVLQNELIVLQNRLRLYKSED